MSTDPAPSKPPRSAMGMRDLGVALGLMVALVLMVGGITRSCSFAPGGPTVDPAGIPVVDAPAELRDLARGVPFALRIPAVPPGWRSNSVGQDRVRSNGVDAGRAVRTGYLTPGGRYLRLLQSDATEAALVVVETGSTPVRTQGPVDVGGRRWVVYTRENDEPIWVADLGDVRLLITGSGSDADFQALAGAAVAGQVLTPAG